MHFWGSAILTWHDGDLNNRFHRNSLAENNNDLTYLLNSGSIDLFHKNGDLTPLNWLLYPYFPQVKLSMVILYIDFRMLGKFHSWDESSESIHGIWWYLSFQWCVHTCSHPQDAPGHVPMSEMLFCLDLRIHTRNVLLGVAIFGRTCDGIWKCCWALKNAQTSATLCYIVKHWTALIHR